MADENENQEVDPFKDFIQEEYNDGELVENKDDKKVDDKKVDDKLEGEDEVVDENDDEKVDDKKVDDKTGDEPPKKKQTAKERIAELTRIRREQERELEEYRTGKRQPAAPAEPAVKIAKLDDIPEEHREAVKAEQQRRVAALGEPPKKPQAKDFEFGAVDEKYLDAMLAFDRANTEYVVRKNEAESKVFDEISVAVSERETALAKFDAKVEEGKKLFDDFDEVVVKGVDEGRFPLSRTVALLMVDSEVGAQVAYHLAKNPDEAKAIAALPDAQQAARFGALEVKFLAETRASPEPKQDPQRKTPQAPAPIEQPRGQGGKFANYADSEDFAAFEKGHQAAVARKSG